MVTARVNVYVNAGVVVIKRNGSTMRRLSPEEAQECGGNIEKAGKIAERSPDEVSGKPITGADDMQKSRNKSRTAPKRRVNKSKNRNNSSNVKKDESWKSDNKNHLINGHM